MAENTTTDEPESNDGHRFTEAEIKIFLPVMTAFEKNEIHSWPNVYFLGSQAQKIQSSADKAPNCGFDDHYGMYRFVPHDHIAYRYEALRVLGRGCFGQVVKAYDHKTKRIVAIKIIRNTLSAKAQARTEVRILNHLKKRKSALKNGIMCILDAFNFREHACIVTECLGTNLYETLQNQKNGRFPIQLVRKFAHSILNALLFLHRNRIIHCDIKPDNIVLRRAGWSSTVLIDFGSSCNENRRIWNYVQSRYYRAPEITLGIPYGMEIDMWSFGCMLPELVTGKPLLPGSDAIDQLAVTMELLGVPPTSVISSTKKKNYDVYFTLVNGRHLPRYYWIDRRTDKHTPTGYGFDIRGQKRFPPGIRDLSTEFDTIVPKVDASFVDFVKQCLAWDPAERLTPPNALKHPWLMNPTKMTNQDSS